VKTWDGTLLGNTSNPTRNHERELHPAAAYRCWSIDVIVGTDLTCAVRAKPRLMWCCRLVTGVYAR
jgi:hypothetical protein